MYAALAKLKWPHVMAVYDFSFFFKKKTEQSGFSHILVNYETTLCLIIYGPVLIHTGIYTFYGAAFTSPRRPSLLKKLLESHK
jgi:hypothetical protein